MNRAMGLKWGLGKLWKQCFYTWFSVFHLKVLSFVGYIRP